MSAGFNLSNHEILKNNEAKILLAAKLMIFFLSNLFVVRQGKHTKLLALHDKKNEI
jgi:hypothetical protein